MLDIGLSFWCEILPDNFEGFFWVIGSDGWFCLFALEDQLNKLGLVLSGAVVGEPVVQVLGADSPTVLYSVGVIEGDALDVGDEDGLGGGKGEVVLLDDDQLLVDGHLVVVVQNLSHFLNYKIRKVVWYLMAYISSHNQWGMAHTMDSGYCCDDGFSRFFLITRSNFSKTFITFLLRVGFRQLALSTMTPHCYMWGKLLRKAYGSNLTKKVMSNTEPNSLARRASIFSRYRQVATSEMKTSLLVTWQSQSTLIHSQMSFSLAPSFMKYNTLQAVGSSFKQRDIADRTIRSVGKSKSSMPYIGARLGDDEILDAGAMVNVFLLELQQFKDGRFVASIVPNEVDGACERGPMRTVSHSLWFMLDMRDSVNGGGQVGGRWDWMVATLRRYFYQLIRAGMNLIDHYGDPSHRKEDQPIPIVVEKRDSGLPPLLATLRDCLVREYPHDHIDIINCEHLTAHSRLGCDHALQFLQRRVSRDGLQFYFQVAFSPTLNMLSIRGNYLRNGLFVHLESKEQVIMALRVVANLNAGLTPLKLSVNSVSGEMLLQHSSFVDAALTDAKFKRNLVNLTFRICFILKLLMKYRFILLYYSCGRKDILDDGGDLMILKGVKQAEERMKAVQSSLREVCLKTYDRNEQVDHCAKRELLKTHAQHFTDGVQQILSLFSAPIHSPARAIAQLANEEYPRSQLGWICSKQDEKFDFRVSLRAEVKADEWRREDVGGNGIIWSSTARIKVLDEEHIKRHPQAAHTPYEQRMAKKTDRHPEKQDRGPAGRSKVSAEKQVISLLDGLSHPNMPTFFIDNRFSRQICLYSLWQENSSMRKYLEKHTVSLYHMLAMLQQAAKGLYFLHRHGIVHCDFKPANLILCRRFLVRLIDFGEAHSFRSGKRGNPGFTFPYAAPEIYARGDITPALDVYALGVTIYRCLFGDYMWGKLLRKHRQQRGKDEGVIPWILPERFREAGERRVALALACLSLKCTAFAAQDRPALPWVITLLQECREYLAGLQYR